ncbi:MAG: class I SAM-dependent methyltransferase [Desulfobacterales bacterium]|nr:class I SAM-dependent methyltransferase [Desulfobacterales bacterium]
MVVASVKVVTEHVLELEPHVLAAVEPLFSIPTHLSMAERLYLLKTGSQLDEVFIACEIGSYVGASTAFLACAASFLKGHIHAVDTWANDGMTDGQTDPFKEFAFNTYHYRHIITAHRGLSSQCVAEIPSALDLLFIDGDHSYNGVLQDMKDYVPKLKKRGMLIMHDTNRNSVEKAITDFCKSTPLETVDTVDSIKSFRK